MDVSASFAGSGTLKNQILGGAPVQVAVLSSELYLDQLKEKGFITSDWRKNPNKGSAIKSVIVFVTRKGNPKGLNTFEDLAKPGTKILHASPDTSGGAQWAIFAIYGAGANFKNLTYGPEDEGVKLLSSVEKNVIAQPESARQTFVQFDAGFGDAIVTYENEALLEKAKGRDYAISVPKKTIETEWKVARIDRNISPQQEHAVGELIKFLYTTEAQRAYAKSGFRPVDADGREGVPLEIREGGGAVHGRRPGRLEERAEERDRERLEEDAAEVGAPDEPVPEHGRPGAGSDLHRRAGAVFPPDPVASRVAEPVRDPGRDRRVPGPARQSGRPCGSAAHHGRRSGHHGGQRHPRDRHGLPPDTVPVSGPRRRSTPSWTSRWRSRRSSPGSPCS